MDASLSFSNRLYFAISILFLVRSTISNNERFGRMDLFEVDSYQHEVEIIPQPVKEIDIKNIIQDDDHADSIVMVAKHGQRYNCLLPDSELDWNSLLDFTSEGERASIPDLLQPLKDKCLLTNEGWWSYKYCHGVGISQFHFEGGKVIGDMVYLGYYDNEKVWTEDNLKKAMEVRIKNKQVDSNVMKLPSHDVHYSNGTTCGLTGKPRSANVKLACSPYHTSSEIITVVEKNTCNYSILIHTPFLCDHPLFVPENKLGRSVMQCSPILSEVKYKQYMKAISKVKAPPTTLEEDNEGTTHKVPLVDLLETLADSLVEEITVEYGKDNGGGTERDHDIVAEDLDTFIENIVTESLNKVLELHRNRDRDGNTAVADQYQDHEENSFPKGPKDARPSNDNTEANSMVSNRSPPAADGGTSSQNIKQSQVAGNGPDDNGYEQTMTAAAHESRDYSNAESFNSVLASMLQELLNDGFLQYSENTSANKNDHKMESRRKTLEERYRSTWEPVAPSDSDGPGDSTSTHED